MTVTEQLLTQVAKRSGVNSATLLMGVTGSGKSSLAYTLALHLWETYRKVLYYYAVDGGGFPAKVQEGVALGIIKLWRMRTRDPGDLGLAFETCYRAAQGCWPRRINPITGEVPPGVELVAPIAVRWQQYCPNGHLVKEVAAQSLLGPQKCPGPGCGVMVTAQNMAVKEVHKESKGFEDRGGVFYDGLSSMLSWEMMEMGQRAGRLELKGEEGAIGGKIISGQMKFGGTTRSHVGFAQTRGEELAHLALGIPNLMVPPVFTALSMEATDEGNLSIVGPKIAGRAKTDEAPQWFGNCLEAAKIPAEQGQGEQFVLYLSEFTDTESRRHLLKNRAAPGTMPDRLTDPPMVGGKSTGVPFSQFNLGLFYRMLDEALTAGIAEAKTLYPDTPGLPTTEFVEYGDGNATVQGTGQVAAPGLTGPPLPAQPTGPSSPAGAASAAPVSGAASTTTVAPKPAAAPKPRAAAAPKAAKATTPQAASAAAAPAPDPVTPAPSTSGTRPAGAPPSAVPVTAQPSAPSAPAAAPPVPVAAPVATARPGAAPRPAGATPPPGRPPASMTTPRPVAAAPRPPAAAPRPPAAAPQPAAPPTPPQE